MGNGRKAGDGKLMERLSRRLREHRRRKNLTQRELASKAEVSEATISNTEHARTLPHPSTVRKLATTFGCKEEELTE
jgi:transcriptional regulator with XRE-family HTH domain